MSYRFKLFSVLNRKSFRSVSLFFFPSWFPLLKYLFCIPMLFFAIKDKSIFFLVCTIIPYIIYRGMLNGPIEELLHRIEVFYNTKEISFPVCFYEEDMKIVDVKNNANIIYQYDDIVLFGENKHYFLLLSSLQNKESAPPLIIMKNLDMFNSDLFRSFILKKCNDRKVYRKAKIV